MNTIKEGIVAKAELFENLSKGIIDFENLKMVNEHVWNKSLTELITEFLSIITKPLGREYILNLVDNVSKIVTINPNFYSTFWEYQNLPKHNQNYLNLLESIYDERLIDVLEVDLIEYLAQLVETTLVADNSNLEKIRKYKNDLKVILENKNI